MEAQQMREMKDREQQVRVPFTASFRFSSPPPPPPLPQIIRLQAARLDLMRDALRKQEEETEFDNLRRVSKVAAALLLLLLSFDCFFAAFVFDACK